MPKDSFFCSQVQQDLHGIYDSKGNPKTSLAFVVALKVALYREHSNLIIVGEIFPEGGWDSKAPQVWN